MDAQHSKGDIRMHRISLVALSFVCTTVLSVATVTAQAPASTSVGPVPPAITNAKRIFVSNAGADSGLFPHPFSGDPDRGYNQFYAALQGTGQWQCVSDPGVADLVLQLRLTAPYGPSEADKQKGASDPLPMFRLAVYDGKSHFLLWALTENVDLAYLQKSHDRNFDDAVTAILKDFEALSSKTQAAAH